jgi:hypothetical protein
VRWPSPIRASSSPIGLSFCYHFFGAPLIADDRRPPEFTVAGYEPCTAAGARLPHFVLDDGTSVYDLLGRDFTLVRVGAKAPDVEKILEASTERKVPLKVVDLPSDAAAERFRAALILVRPDQYIAWRGAEIHAAPAALIDRVRGGSRVPSMQPAG